MTTIGNRRLPAFDRPPVVETALGVEFSPLAQWGVPHFGLFWEKIRNEYPRFQVQPPLGSQIEKFGRAAAQAPALTIEFGDPARLRCWFFNTNDVQLLQVQDSRFILNWRKATEATEYPHYATFRPQFEAEWNRFCSFLAENHLPLPAVLQCEVTYVNVIPKGAGWESFGELSKVTKVWSDGTSALPPPEQATLNARYVMPGDRGRLHVSLQPAIRNTDASEILQLTLTARGQPSGPSVREILEWFDTGHAWIVEGFADITTDKMHSLWKRTA